MRIQRLELEGFGPYLRRQEIDFTAFDAHGLFAITGKTGAGKSTILDAICFALYDRVPRYEKAEPVLRSHFCGEDDPTSVTLDFQLGAEDYRVWRSPAYARAKKRGTGTTTKGAEARLYVRRGSEWEIIAGMPREVGEHISAILPLSGDQFLQVILLAQGRFAEFLRADTGERRTVLRSLFGTQRFEDLEERIRERARAATAAVEAADASLEALVERAARLVGADVPTAGTHQAFWEETARAVDLSADQSAAARAEAAAIAEAAAAALSQARDVERTRERLERARATVAELESRAGEQAEREARIAVARRAVPVAGPLRERDRAARAAEDAAAALERARETAAVDPVAALALRGAAPADRDEAALRAREAELAGEIGALTGALAAEGALPGLDAELRAAQDAVETATAAHRETSDAVEALPAQEQALRERLDAARVTAARVEDLAAGVARAQAAVAAHAVVARLDEELAVHTDAARAAEATHATAAEHYAQLVRRRLASQAAHLAAALEDGQPCPVCGGVEHPSPAEESEDHVTDEEVDAAFEASAAAKDVADRDRNARTETEAALAGAREKAGEGDAASADAALTQATAAHDQAMEAAREADRLGGELEALGARRTQLAQTLERLAAQVAAAQETVTRAAAALESARSQAQDRPKGYGTVAEYAAALAAARALVARLITATSTAEDAAVTRDSAAATFAQALEESGLADADAVREAALEAAELARLDAAAEQHRSGLAAAHAVVEELSDRELPEEVADLDALEEAARAAGEARDAAIEAATRAASRAAEVAALRAEHGRLGESTAAARAERDVVLTLADALEGKAPNDRRLRLESFVLASKLERIVAAANARLTTMSSGQYQLEHDDSAQYRGKETGLALRIADAHTGQSRSTRSLSGGETFLASLALALGLAETVTAEAGGITLQTLFIDEGFGSLDGDTLEVAMSTLTDLRDAGRTVGLISHVEAMHDAIPAQLEVVKAADGSSRVATRLGDLV